jgi:excisionase family DNA binding protein
MVLRSGGAMAMLKSVPEAAPMTAGSGPVASHMSVDLHELLTVDDVAALLKVSKSWVYEHTRARGRSQAEQLPHIKVGKYVRFEPAALRRFIEKRCRTT